LKVDAAQKFHLSTTWQRADVEQYFNYDQIPAMFKLQSGVDFGEMAWTLGEELGAVYETLVTWMGGLHEHFDFIHKEGGFNWEHYSYMVGGVEQPWHPELIHQGYFDVWEGGHDLLGLLAGTAAIAIISKVVPVKTIAGKLMNTLGVKKRHGEVTTGIEEILDKLDNFGGSVTPARVPDTEWTDETVHAMLEGLIDAWANNSRQPLNTLERAISKAKKNL